MLIVSPWEIDWKGVATGLEAVRHLREDGFECVLLRMSQWPLADDERCLAAPDEYHCRITTHDAARLVRSADLLLAPSWEAEGFGLPVLEAMASGVPVVASDISCFRELACSAAALVPSRSPEQFADAARRVLQSPARWRRMRRAGLQVARRYREAAVSTSLQEAVHWVADGAWRSDRPTGRQR